jgi:hypothetical protein
VQLATDFVIERLHLEVGEQLEAEDWEGERLHTGVTVRSW